MGLSPDEVVSFEAKPDPKRQQAVIAIGLGILLLLGGFLYQKFSTVTLGENETGFPILVDGKWGFINAKGKNVVLPRFDAAERISGGMAAVMVDNEWGYIN